MTDREQLAARIEAAGGPDRELDTLIDIFGMSTSDNASIREMAEHYKALPDGQIEVQGNVLDWHGLHYTASLDAAMMLVPEGHLWHVSGGLNWGYVTIESGDDRIEDFKGNAATPALALSAAAIRAGGA